MLFSPNACNILCFNCGIDALLSCTVLIFNKHLCSVEKWPLPPGPDTHIPFPGSCQLFYSPASLGPCCHMRRGRILISPPWPASLQGHGATGRETTPATLWPAVTRARSCREALVPAVSTATGIMLSHQHPPHSDQKGHEQIWGRSAGFRCGRFITVPNVCM